jgi:two-component system, cell cycle sensor histidine kinase and response regulator CckA
MIAIPAKNILIVEDDKEIASSMAKALEDIGHRVVAVFSSGEEAMDHAKKSPSPDLVIMDVNLEGAVDGIQAGKYIEDHLNLPVIYITGYLDKAALLEQEGRVPIMKPFTARELKTAIDVVLYIISAKNADRKRSAPQDAFRDKIQKDLPTLNPEFPGAS